MSLYANIYPSAMALTGNPVKLSIKSDTLATYSILDGETTVYTGSGDGDINVFIQDILATIVKPVELYNESPDILIYAAGTSRTIHIAVTNTAGESANLTLKVFVGGVSKRTLRRLADDNSNIFTRKLLNPEANFFQTTRTSGRMICIRETELFPIPFLYPSGTLKIVASGIETTIPGITGEAMALNLYRLRKNLFENNHLLASMFDVYVDTTKACTIVLTPGTVSRERYLLRFLNSFGAYEYLEVNGIGKIDHKSDGGEEVYHVYDELVDDYVEERNRQSSRDTLQVETGYRSQDELIPFIDLLSSDDVKIIGLDGRNIKVAVSSDNLSSVVRQTTPESLKMTLRFAESEHHHTGSLTEENFGSPRIHTEQFTQELN